ncbi:MAG: hypothetical protein GC160_00310 [Acidobacteria bacterium]|nr:hypothetical protein [Acidobacteriota bacterium]
MARFRYRLQAVLDQKKEVRERAQEELTRSLRAQQEAEEILAQLRNKEQELRDKKAELRTEMVTVQASAQELRRRRDYIQRVGEELDAAGAEVFGQRILVDECVENVDRARLILADAIREAEALEKHREKQETEFYAEIERKEALELDEAATQSYLRRRGDAN